MGMHGKHHSQETKDKIRQSLLGKHRFGWKLSEETKKRQIDCRKGIPISEEAKHKISEKLKGRKLPKEVCIKMGMSRKGENNPAWKGGVSFAPYCPKFNETFKKRVREYYNNECAICGATGRLHIHHVDYNKQACCDGSKPRFIALCNVCHGKTNHNRDYWRQHLGEHFKLYTP